MADNIKVVISPKRDMASVTIAANKEVQMPTALEIEEALKIAGVVFGIDKQAVDELAHSRRFGSQVVVAKAKMPIDGVDATIDFLFPCTDQLAPRKNDKGVVDYRDLGLITNIYTDTLIANITPPSEQEDGVDVTGFPMVAKIGKPLKYTVGKGTYITEDELELRAGIDGNLKWDKTHFVVEDVLVISKNIDASTGNIDFIGPVNIKGEIKEGFTVISKQSVTVNGTITGATIIADGDVTLNLGCINSNITSRGNVKISFTESSKIECDGDLISQSFISCDVFCAGTIYATTGKGIVAGGRYTALIGCEVNILGSQSYAKTKVTLGKGAVLSEELLLLEVKKADMEEQIKKLIQIVNLLNDTKKKQGTLPPDREDMLLSSIRSRFTYSREVKQIEQRIGEVNAELQAQTGSSVIVHKQLYPGVNLRIGTISTSIDVLWQRVSVGIDPKTGEIQFKNL